MAASKKVIARDEWENKLSGISVSKKDMNKLVMNYLVTEGYVDAAEKFQDESETEIQADIGFIMKCKAIKKDVENGDIEDAIEKINDLNPEILNKDPGLYFRLQQQLMIELIRRCKTHEALDYAQKELAPKGKENPIFLVALERTMSLLAFEDFHPSKHLMEISTRYEAASQANAAILATQNLDKEPKLCTQLKTLKWVQNKLDRIVDYPRQNVISTARP